jgi:ATP adenylyltransferase
VAERLELLWAPFRLAYVTSDAAAGGCPFCTIPDLPDDEGLVVHRGTTAYVVLNRYPYNPGHLMVLPYRHVGGLDELSEDELVEVTRLTRDAVVALRAVSNPHGFNTGLNLGGVAGGSLAGHLHQHVVPRWGGDANFMTVTAATKVLPQLLAETRDMLAAAWVPGAARAPGPGLG